MAERGPVDLAWIAAALGHLLHVAGLPVGPDRSGRFAAAVALTRPADLDELYWAARVTLLSGHEQVATFDRVFGQVFGGLVDVAGNRGDTTAPPPASTRPGPRRPPVPGRPAGSSPMGRPGSSATPGHQAGTPDAVLAAASTEERLAHRDFASLTADELLRLRELVADLPLVAPLRRSRRLRRDRSGDRIDLRGTVRRARRTGGDAVVLRRRRARLRPRRLVLVADVSGSMEPYARAYLHLLHAAVRAARAETFVFATRLTRLTRILAGTDPNLALRRAEAAAPDWSGGTRIGAALRAFNDTYGRRGLARGAVVVVVSDGWERDDPAELAEQLRRLRRLAHLVVWVNPRKAAPGYEPLAAGMAAALPHVDAFVSGHSLEAVREVLAAIAGSPHPSRAVRA